MTEWKLDATTLDPTYDLAAESLGEIGVTAELRPEELGKYVSTTSLGKFEKMAMGPYWAGVTEIEEFLYELFATGSARNRSHIDDPELNRMLIAQRKEMDPTKRREIVLEIQRYLADKAYYVCFQCGRAISPTRHT